MNNIFDVIIIGAGPAGISAAIQLKRYGIKFLIFEKDSIGGLLKNASLVENYPGFPKGIKGTGLIKLFKKHLSGLGIGIKKENVIDVNYNKKEFSITTKNELYFSHNIIIASGTKPKDFSPNNSSSIKYYNEISRLEKEYNKEIAIIGGGDAAFDYAVSLSGNNNKVSIIHRGSRPSCIPALRKTVLRKKNISYFSDLKIAGAARHKGRNIIECINLINQEKKIIACDILVVATGREPQLKFIKQENRKKLFSLNGKSLYFIGDVKNKIYRQATISIGDGIRAAMEISHKLNKEYENYS